MNTAVVTALLQHRRTYANNTEQAIWTLHVSYRKWCPYWACWHHFWHLRRWTKVNDDEQKWLGKHEYFYVHVLLRTPVNRANGIQLSPSMQIPTTWVWTCYRRVKMPY